jgi:hypothetical protein
MRRVISTKYNTNNHNTKLDRVDTTIREGQSMSTAQELAQNVGKTALLRVSGTSLWFEVEIMDARQRYGNLDYKVKPVMGEGEQWHQADSMKVRDEVTSG